MERDSSLVFHCARHVVLCWFYIVPWRLICVSLHYSWIRVIKCNLKMLTFNFFCIFQRKGFWSISFWFMRSLWNLRRLSCPNALESIVPCSCPHILSCWRFNVKEFRLILNIVMINVAVLCLRFKYWIHILVLHPAVTPHVIS